MRAARGTARSLIPARVDDLAPGAPRAPAPISSVIPADGKPSSECCKALPVPYDWFLRTLPVKSNIYPFSFAMQNAYGSNAGGDATQISGTYQVNEGTSLILSRYGFYATEPDIGPSRTKMIPPHELINQVQFFFQVNGREPIQAGYNVVVGGTSTPRRGMAILMDPNFDRLATIPVMIRGQADLEAFWLTITNPSWTITNIGFYMEGFSVDTTTLDKSLQAAGLG